MKKEERDKLDRGKMGAKDGSGMVWSGRTVAWSGGRIKQRGQIERKNRGSGNGQKRGQEDGPGKAEWECGKKGEKRRVGCGQNGGQRGGRIGCGLAWSECGMVWYGMVWYGGLGSARLRLGQKIKGLGTGRKGDREMRQGE